MKTIQTSSLNKIKKILFYHFSGLGFPIYTLVLILLSNPLYTNLSYIGNGLGYRAAVLLWGIVGAFIFRQLLFHLAQPFHISWLKRMDSVFIIMVVSLGLPYLPTIWPFLAQLHILASYAAFGLLNYLIVTILFHGRYFYKETCQKALQFTTIILSVCGALFLIFGSINSLLELFYTCSMTWLLLYVSYQVQKKG